MIIGIISDSHGDKQAIKLAAQAIEEADCWLHAGDLYPDSEFLAKITDKPVYGVAGNCDLYGFFAKEPPEMKEKFLELGGKKIWLLHGHRYDVKGTTADLIEEAENMAVDIVVYGHTHIVDVTERKNLLVLNPGSVSRPRFYGSPKTCMRLAIDGGKVSVEIIDLA